MKRLLTLLMFLTTPAIAKVERLELEVRKIQFLRHPYLPNKTDWRGLMGLHWDTSHWNNRVFWNNFLAGYGDNAKFQYMYWEYEVGVNIERFQIGYYHKSEHLLDSNRVDVGHPDKFPLEDSFFLKWDLLK